MCFSKSPRTPGDIDSCAESLISPSPTHIHMHAHRQTGVYTHTHTHTHTHTQHTHSHSVFISSRRVCFSSCLVQVDLFGSVCSVCVWGGDAEILRAVQCVCVCVCECVCVCVCVGWGRRNTESGAVFSHVI